MFPWAGEVTVNDPNHPINYHFDSYVGYIINALVYIYMIYVIYVYSKYVYNVNVCMYVYGNYISIYGLVNIRTGILNYLREGFPWPARPFKTYGIQFI